MNVVCFSLEIIDVVVSRVNFYCWFKCKGDVINEEWGEGSVCLG